MNQLSPGPHEPHTTGPDTTAGTAPHAGANTAKYDAVVGPFTIRDLTVFGSALLMFIASLLPMFGGLYNLWNVDNLFFLLLGILLPLAVVALFVARRLQPRTVVRVGSLSIDQFASVTASFALALFFLTIAVSFNVSVLLGLVGSVGLLAATVLAPHLPWLSADFKGRAETPAHVVARQAPAPSRKPVAPKAPKPPKSPKPSAASSATGPTASTSTGPTASTSAAAASSGVPGAVGASSGSPFAPPAASGAEPSQATAAPAVVHSVDSKPAAKPEPAAAGPATAASPAVPVITPEPSAEPSPAEPDVAVTPAEKTGSAATEPATTQHAQQPVAQQPAAERPWAATMATPIVSGDTRTVSDSIGATVDPSSRPDESDSHSYEAFWFAVAQPRTAYDERTGAPVFTIEPGGWVLALEDRGHEFLVQDTDGKVGVLSELSNIERG